MSAGTTARGPPIAQMTKTNISANGRSTMIAKLADPIISFKISKSRTVVDRAPVDCRLSVISNRAMRANKRSDITRSMRAPAISINVPRTVLIIKSNTMMISIMMVSAHRLSIAELGTIRS